MKKKFIFLFVLFVSVLIPFHLTAQNADVFRQEGIASWYGREFEGRPTASGEIFDSSQFTAAHPTLPFGTMLVVTNQHNNKSVMVRVNDRGPFVPMRIIDVSRAAAEQLDMIVTGTAPVTVQSIDRIAVPSAAVGAQIEAQSVIAPPESLITFISDNPDVRETALRDSLVHLGVEVITQYANESSAAASGADIIPSAAAPVTHLRITPDIVIVPSKNYRFQVGSYTNARNAVDAFERLKNSGLNPAYERFVNGSNVEFFRVVVAGVRGVDVQSTIERIRAAGFTEALIREEN